MDAAKHQQSPESMADEVASLVNFFFYRAKSWTIKETTETESTACTCGVDRTDKVRSALTVASVKKQATIAIHIHCLESPGLTIKLVSQYCRKWESMERQLKRNVAKLKLQYFGHMVTGRAGELSLCVLGEAVAVADPGLS